MEGIMVRDIKLVMETDSYYGELKELKNGVNRQLLNRVRERFYDGCRVKRKVGHMKNYYKEHDTMEDYISRVADKYGDIQSMNEAIERLALTIVKEFNKKEARKVNEKQVKQCLLIVLFLETFVIYKNEEIVKTVLSESGYFKVQTMSRYNSEYGTDFVVKLKHEDYSGIGIRIKSRSYLYASGDKKKCEFEKQKQLGGVYGVYYLFNNGTGYSPYTVEDKILYNNEIVCDEENQFYDTFLDVAKDMTISDYNCLIDKLLELFYIKDNLGMLSFDDWKAYMKDYESEDDFRSRMCIEAELESMNMFMK